MQTTQSIFLGVAAAVLLAGCGSAASSSSSSAAAGAAPSSAPAGGAASQGAGTGATASLTCALAPSSLVSTDLGVAGLGDPKQVVKDGSASCVYSGPKGLVSLNLLNGATTDKMSLEQQTMAKSEQVKAFPGLGDEAFSATLSVGSGLPSSNTLVARQGTVEIMVTSSADVTAEKSLEQHILAKTG
jgi:ABC-type Fe3+-hydroxamate transport system substrate-binding protein